MPRRTTLALRDGDVLLWLLVVRAMCIALMLTYVDEFLAVVAVSTCFADQVSLAFVFLTT